MNHRERRDEPNPPKDALNITDVAAARIVCPKYAGLVLKNIAVLVVRHVQQHCNVKVTTDRLGYLIRSVLGIRTTRSTRRTVTTSSSG